MPPEISLPAIDYTIPHSSGYIRHALRAASAVTVEHSEQISVSSRKREPLLRLSNGESILVTTRKSAERPPGADGILREANGRYSWLSHRLLDDNATVTAAGLAERKREILSSWSNAIRFVAERRGSDGVTESAGLRPPQLGGLHAIGAHWSYLREPATVVMPTGTGKTEAMLAAIVAYEIPTTLIIVPSRVLRDQTAIKAFTLGLLRPLGVLSDEAMNPIVGVLARRPRTAQDLDMFVQCNIVISTMNALAQGTAVPLADAIARRVGTLIVDEAHHVAARTWSAFRQAFKEARILQFTATPYRSDGALVDGKVIYNYPLRTAQQNGYFKKITFDPVYEVDATASDRAIITKALTQLRTDRQAGYDHLIMARCANITRAHDLHSLYREQGDEFRPVVIHSEIADREALLEEVRSRNSRVVICVDMLGEGFDLPQLKIAAVHDTHKSLAILMQFTGRFTRTAGRDVGDATVIANIADQQVSAALERLYSEDADWNQLLSEYSSDAVQRHAALIEFLRESHRLDDESDDSTTEVSHQLLRPKLSTVVFKTDVFQPHDFHKGLGRQLDVHRVWLNDQSRTLFFVTVQQPRVDWTRSRELRDRQWDLYVVHHDAEQGLLYIHSSDKTSLHRPLAEAIGGPAAVLLSGDRLFRILGNINRLVLYNLGVRKHGRRNLRYAMYTGEAVQEALTLAERAGSEKNNLFGTGYENGGPVSVGCSIKGRLWSRDQGSIPEWLAWCKHVGAKLLDESINTTDIIANVLIPEEVARVPEATILSIDWPDEILHMAEEKVVLQWDAGAAPIGMFDIKVSAVDQAASLIRFDVSSSDVTSTLFLELGGPQGFRVGRDGGAALTLKTGRNATPLETFLSDYPPLMRFVDMSELNGNLLIKPRGIQDLHLPSERFETWAWAGVDFNVESMIRNGELRVGSIQERAADHYRDGGFDVVFDDDDPGEAADLVCLKEETDYIRLALVHCKGTRTQAAGGRVRDVAEVASQAVRSAKWQWRFRELCKHLAARERGIGSRRPSRFVVGDGQAVSRYAAKSRFKPIKAEIVIVQPGLSKAQCSPDQTTLLAAAHSFLNETIGVDLDIVCSD